MIKGVLGLHHIKIYFFLKIVLPTRNAYVGGIEFEIEFDFNCKIDCIVKILKKINILKVSKFLSIIVLVIILNFKYIYSIN